MTPLDALVPRWPEINALLDEALALPAQDRASWLASLGADREALKPTLSKLLGEGAGVETGAFLRTLPKLEGASRSLASSHALAGGDRVGPYRLVAEVGSGGMGAVWRAVRADGTLEREVALKLPLLNRLRPDIAARFMRERDILAGLEHPHIARLYDAGVDADGTPYLAMEYVQGEPLDAYCDGRHLGLRARLALFDQVLGAVQHAHANLVIHRDLKPSNILVTAQGEVRLLDFGIAKLLTDAGGAAETELTRLSGRALTPDYASPEQIQGEALTIATDVYSLGVVLYVLLTGQRPYRLKLGSAAQLEQAIVSADAPRPSTVVTAGAALARDASPRKLARALAGDLDTIVQKALAKAPGERYATAAEFAQDIGRHLRQEPITARPAGVGLRLRKLVRRNKAVTFAAAGIVVALTGGLAAALWQAEAAREQARYANQAVGRQEGVRHFQAEVVASIAALSPAAFAQPHAVAEVVMRKLAELEPQYATRPSDWGGVLNAAMVLFEYIGELEHGLNATLRYIEVLKKTDASADTIAEAHVAAGRAASLLGRWEESEKLLRGALPWAPASDSPWEAAVRLDVIGDLAIVLQRLGQRAQAKTELERARQLGEQQLPNDRRFARLLLQVGRVELGFDARAAVAAFERSKRVFLADKQTKNHDLSTINRYLGIAYLESGRLDEAQEQLRSAHAMDLKLYGATDRDTITALGALALAVARGGGYAQAFELLAEGAAALRGNQEPKQRALATVLTGRQLETALLAGDLKAAEAIDRLTEGAGEARDAAVPNGHVLPLARIDLLLMQGRIEQAERTLTDWRAAQGARPPVAEPFLWMLAQARLQLARGDALGASQRTAALIREMREAGVVCAWPLVETQEWAAVAAAEAGQPGPARRFLDEASATRALLRTASAVEAADSQLRQARALLALGRTADAQSLARSALLRLEAQHPDSPRLALARRISALAP